MAKRRESYSFKIFISSVSGPGRKQLNSRVLSNNLNLFCLASRWFQRRQEIEIYFVLHYSRPFFGQQRQQRASHEDDDEARVREHLPEEDHRLPDAAIKRKIFQIFKLEIIGEEHNYIDLLNLQVEEIIFFFLKTNNILVRFFWPFLHFLNLKFIFRKREAHACHFSLHAKQKKSSIFVCTNKLLWCVIFSNPSPTHIPNTSQNIPKFVHKTFVFSKSEIDILF